MNLNKLLIEVSRCPICNGSKRIEDEGMSEKKTLGYYYLKPVADNFGLSVDLLVENIKVYRCLECESFYCSPWFGIAPISQLFNVLSPTHIAGWRNFEYWLRGKNIPTDDRNEQIIKILTSKFGAPKSYAEFGCPFQGLLPIMETMRGTSPIGRIKRFSEAIRIPNDVRLTRLTFLYNTLHSSIMQFLKVLINLERLLGITKTHEGANLAAYFEKVSKTLLTTDTSLSWGGNCTRFGKSCRALASSIFGADIVPLTEYSNQTSGLIDIIGVFNTLDHTRNPMQVLDKLTTIGRSIVLVNHRATSAGRQHSFAFANNLASYLQNRYANLNVIDLSGELEPPATKDFVILIHR